MTNIKKRNTGSNQWVFFFQFIFLVSNFFAKYSSSVFFLGKISRIFTEKNLKIVVKCQDFPPKIKSQVLAGPQNIAGFFNYSTFPSIYFPL